MTVYIDPLCWHGWQLYGRPVKNCHLFADGPLEELHQFAQGIGLKRAWFQDGSIPHYDLVASMRAKAVASGAVEVDRDHAVALRIKIRARKNL